MNAEDPPGFIRLFVAIPVPPEVRRPIGRAQDRLRRHTPPGAVRWTRADQFHLTLKFLGDVPSDQVTRIAEALAVVGRQFPAPTLSAQGVGFFPNARQPRVIWAGTGGGEVRLPELHRQLETALRWLAPAEASEKFAAHITLGRFKPGHHAAIPQTLEAAASLREWHFGDWRAGQVELIRSELTSSGAEHVVLASFPLAA